MQSDGFTLVVKKSRPRKKSNNLVIEVNLPLNLDKFNVTLIANNVKSHLNNKFDKCVCYGLGSLGLRVSQIQLKFLIELALPVELFDPQFTIPEMEYLAQLGFVILKDTQCIYTRPNTCFFIPHGLPFMYQNVIASNDLKSIAIIGNNLVDFIQITAPVIYPLLQLENAFNNTCVHLWP